jgi:hypothetical protein
MTLDKSKSSSRQQQRRRKSAKDYPWPQRHPNTSARNPIAVIYHSPKGALFMVDKKNQLHMIV